MVISIKHHLQLYVLLLSLVFSSTLIAKIFVHHLHYQKAEHLLPAIQAQLDKNAKLSANEYQLIVNSSLSDNIKVLNILKELDQPRNAYQVEIKLVDKPINPSQNTQNRIERRTKVSEQQTPATKNYSITSKAHKNIYFQATALDNIPLIVKQLVSYPMSSVFFYHGLYFPTTKRANLHKGFNILIHQSKDDQLLVQISASSHTVKSMQPETQIKLLTSTELLVKKNQWVLFAASSEQPLVKKEKRLTKENIANKAVNQDHNSPINDQALTNKTYTTGNGNSSSKWFYLKITDLILD